MTSGKHVCPIWGTSITIYPTTREGWDVESPRAGGRYFVSGTAYAMLQHLEERRKAKLTSWLVEQRRLGVDCPEITSRTLKEIEVRRPLTFRDRADQLLKFLEAQQRHVGEPICIALTNAAETLYGDGFTEQGAKILAYSESTKTEEAEFFIRQLESEGFLKEEVGCAESVDYIITFKGYTYLSELDKKGVVSTQAFVAMWFDDAMTDVYDNGIAQAIRDAGYEPLRIDRKDHNNKIDDEIIAEIRRSRFLVADFTADYDLENPDAEKPEKKCARGGVYYEAGFAHGLNIPVIFTCRKDIIGKVHFDTRQYNHIDWTTPDELRERLTQRISATLGDGPLRKMV